ncbi:conserved exported hypothetical protein [Cupriavidus taiwanensis]|uniref:tripartite tricarboxylate transporter substrate binding protein n=1 Tax=Cupriavidus taiwanensis TaxID=164546 RepID=UPI000E195E8E|nr:tripartite tricarboxylate transporter substrate binding protein [Cupriavidus taiwanensis]SPA39632.1 conserved exported hypothetical protein [Cupriavidus taiwanensis]
MNTDRRRALGALGALAAWPLARAAQPPAAWPEKPVRLILPYAAGGPTDAVARALATRMSQQLGQPMVVENRVGASGNIACELVARSAPDGYTVLYHSSGFAISPALYKRLSYDPLRDFAPVAMTATIPAVLMVNPSLPVATMAQFEQYLKARPGKLSYGTGGVGNITHLLVALLLQARGLQASHVPYKGTAPAMTDLIGGQTQFMLDAVSSALPFIRDGRVRALAVTSERRVAALPDVPTLAETVMPGFVAPTWHGMLVPARTPAPVIQRLNAAANLAAQDPTVRAQFAPQGVSLQASTPERFAGYLRTETSRWADAARAAGVEPE